MAYEWALRQVRSVAERENPGWGEAEIQRLANRRSSGSLSVKELRILGETEGANEAPWWATRQVRSVDEKSDQFDWNAQEEARLAGMRANGMSLEGLQNRADAASRFGLNYPWLPDELKSVWIDAFVEHDDSALAWQEVRNGEGKAIYDQIFPGNRREDGTLRLSEPAYLSTKAQYRNSLMQRGLNPDVFEGRFSELIGNEVSAQEFESRIAAVNENIAQRSDEIRRAFAEASGLQDFSPEATLAAVLDPDGVGRELLERRISLAQVRGTAAEFGFNRSEERVNQLLARVDISEQQARQFFGGLESQLERLNTFSAAARGTRNVGVGDLEEATLLQDQRAVESLERLLGRERAQFSSQRNRIRRSQQGGGMSGLSSPGQAG